MPLLKFWQIYQRLQDSLATRTLDEFASDVIELTGYKAMLEADAAKGTRMPPTVCRTWVSW